MPVQSRNKVSGVDGVVLKDVIPQRSEFWWNYPGLRTLNFLLLGAICCDITNGYDGSMLNGLQILPQWQKYFGEPNAARLGLISNGVRIGQIAALPFVSLIIQKFGRRKPIAYGSVLMLLGIALQAGAQNMAMFVIARVLIGFGNNIQGCAAPILLAELAYPSQRPTIMGIMNTTGSLGQLMAAWVGVPACMLSASAKMSSRSPLQPEYISVLTGAGACRVCCRPARPFSKSAWSSLCPSLRAGSCTTTGEPMLARFCASTTPRATKTRS